MATTQSPNLSRTFETKHIRIIGVPLDLGQSRRGVDMGPSAMRVAGLEVKLEALGYDVKDAGNIRVALGRNQVRGQPQCKVPEGNYGNLLQRGGTGGEDFGRVAQFP